MVDKYLGRGPKKHNNNKSETHIKISPDIKIE